MIVRTVMASPLGAVAFAPPWSEPATVGEGGRQPNFPSIAFGTDGTGVVSWTPATKPNEPQPPSWLRRLAGAAHREPGALVDDPALFGRDGVALLRVRNRRLSVGFGTARARVERWQELARNREVLNARLVASRRGHVLVGWVERRGRTELLRLATSTSGRRLTVPVTLARVFDDAQIALAIGERGDAVVVYTVERSGATGYADGVEVRVRPADGTFGRPQRIGPSRGMVDLSAAVARNGAAVVGWGTIDEGEQTDQPFDVFAATKAPGGRFGAPADLGPGELEGAVADADGNALLVFRNYNVLRASFRAAGEPAFRAPEDVSGPGEFVRTAVVAADPRSHSATVVWEGVTGPRQDPLQQTIRMARRPLR